ncbi:hypothetical protein ACFLYA_00630 [Candidatus Dependentiae bacterium]
MKKIALIVAIMTINGHICSMKTTTSKSQQEEIENSAIDLELQAFKEALYTTFKKILAERKKKMGTSCSKIRRPQDEYEAIKAALLALEKNPEIEMGLYNKERTFFTNSLDSFHYVNSVFMTEKRRNNMWVFDHLFIVSTFFTKMKHEIHKHPVQYFKITDKGISKFLSKTKIETLIRKLNPKAIIPQIIDVEEE